MPATRLHYIEELGHFLPARGLFVSMLANEIGVSKLPTIRQSRAADADALRSTREQYL